ncbi:DUF4269 domain-containing protein [Parahaliea aestuarii]|uniref:DUF4269 domain-containing protein n=1 Tax=Parahaliea aestuarii TaxID=1852021 RepID=UPI00164F1343|nr:DUF4269 domain-containing protein [Parahaliea aestuarii]
METRLVLAKEAVADCQVLAILAAFSPEIVSTIYVGFDTPDSDIDIVCSCSDAGAFERVFSRAYASCDGYVFTQRDDYAVGRFRWRDFMFEVFVAGTPVTEQLGYRHFKLMQRLSRIGGERFRQRVRALKLSGLKTEPALCALLGLPGDPYQAVLVVETWSDREILDMIDAHLV